MTNFEGVDTAIDLALERIDVAGEFEVDGRVLVTDALRITVARGVTAAAMLLTGPEDDEEPYVD